jgi:hypothetical protein
MPGKRKLLIAAALLATACAAHAQTASEPGPAPADPPGLREDIRAFASAPLRWRGREWLRFAGVLGAVSLAYQYDDRVRAHFANDGEPDYHEVVDAMPSAFVFGGMWFADKLGRSEEARMEHLAMRRAIVLETLSSEVLKIAFRRERPGPGVSRNGWGDGGLSFPSGHTATAFAIGTVLAESGDDRHRWLRRVMGYGLGAGTAYLRLDHDAHWLSDTVAGAALGIVTAKFVLKRRERPEPRGTVAFVPTPWGTTLTYTVPLR